MRGRSDILGSLHNRTLHILIRQLPLFINQRGTLQLSAKVVFTGDKYFLAQRTRNVGLFLGPFGLFCCDFPHSGLSDLKLQMKSNFKLPGYCRSVHECCDAYYCGQGLILIIRGTCGCANWQLVSRR